MTPNVGRARRCGFTLVEVAVVVTILGVAAAVAAPSLARLMRGGVDAVISDVVSAYGAAREVAASRGAPTSVLLELGTGSYWVVAEPSLTSGVDTIRQGRLRLTPTIRLSGGSRGWAITTFDALGRSRGRPVFVAEGREIHEIVTDPWTATVNVQRR